MECMRAQTKRFYVSWLEHYLSMFRLIFGMLLFLGFVLNVLQAEDVLHNDINCPFFGMSVSLGSDLKPESRKSLVQRLRPHSSGILCPWNGAMARDSRVLFNRINDKQNRYVIATSFPLAGLEDDLPDHSLESVVGVTQGEDHPYSTRIFVVDGQRIGVASLSKDPLMIIYYILRRGYITKITTVGLPEIDETNERTILFRFVNPDMNLKEPGGVAYRELSPPVLGKLIHAVWDLRIWVGLATLAILIVTGVVLVVMRKLHKPLPRPAWIAFCLSAGVFVGFVLHLWIASFIFTSNAFIMYQHGYLCILLVLFSIGGSIALAVPDPESLRKGSS